MNLKLLLCSVLLLLLVVLDPARAESLDETVIKKIDLKSDSVSLDQISGSIEPTDSKLNVSDQSLKNISDKLSPKEDELNLKKVSQREAKGDDKKETNPSSKLFLTKDELLIGSNGKDKAKHKDTAQTNEDSKPKDAKPEQQDDAPPAAEKEKEKEKADDLPSFDEWKKKVVEEEPNNQQSSATINASNKRLFQNPAKGNKLRIRNYASSECGAKVINSNKEAQGSYKILSESQDEYMLNPCNSKIWFIVELCEAIKLSSIEVANYELFSSTFRNFLIYGSGHYPTRDWQLIGNFTANDVKQVQEFPFSGEVEFRKFLKIEILSHHGSEHFCPFSLVRVFGTSMTDEFDEIENKITIPIEEIEMLESNHTNESRPEKNYLNEKSMFYKILRKVAAFFYKTLPERDRKDKTKEENFATFLRDRDTLDAIIEQSVMSMMPTLEPKLSLCLNLDQQSKKRRNRRIQLCNYLRTLIGTTTFDLLLKEMHKEHDQQFKCRFNSNSSELLDQDRQLQANSSSEHGDLKSNLESSMLDQVLPNPDEKESSISSGDFMSISDSLKITSSNSQSTILLPTPTIVIRPEEQADELSTISSSLDLLGENADDAARKVEKSIELEDGRESSSPSDERQLRGEETNGKPTATVPVEGGSTATPAAPEQSIKTAEKTSTPLENTPIVSSKTMQPDDELPNGTPLSGSSSKESIFIRMMNKIKTLELNLSLSSQYLEELSQRYRRQMDEMQKNFNQTIFKLNETSKTAAEKDNRQQLLLDRLGSKISELEEKLFILIAVIIAKVIFDLVSWYRR